jgi:hypothetical protein
LTLPIFHKHFLGCLDALIPGGRGLFEQAVEKVDFEDAVFLDDFEILGILVQRDGNDNHIGACETWLGNAMRSAGRQDHPH